jgi:cysteine desulfurase
MIYLDHNATTRPAPEVVEAMELMLREHWHNPSSIHRAGQGARQRVELARKHLAELIGARPRFITLTGSGTEALDLAIRGHLLARGLIGAVSVRKREAPSISTPCTIIISPIEHIGVRELCRALEREEGVRVLTAELDGDGVVDVGSVTRLLDEHTDAALVSVQWANNETGAIQPAPEIGELCRARGVMYHCDATQWVGKMGVRVQQGEGPEASGESKGIKAGEIVCDLLTFSPHKFHGPKGLGVLYARAGVRTAPLIHGEQEMGRRGGTENVPGIVGAGVAAQLAMAWLSDPENPRRVGALRDRFERAVLAAVPEARVNGAAGRLGRLYNTSSIGFPGLEAEALLLLLSERGVCCSAGAACSSGSLEASPVIKAMKIPTDYAHGTLRFSLSRQTTEAEVDEAVRILAASVARLKESWKG